MQPLDFQLPGTDRRGVKYRQHEADELYHAEMRAEIARLRARQWGPKAIAAHLGVSRKTVVDYMATSMDRVAEAVQSGEDPSLPDPATPRIQYRRRGPGAGPHRRGSPKSVPVAPALAPFSTAVALPTTVHNRAWELRKRAMPFDEIGRLLGISEKEARDAVRKRLNELDQLELESTDEARTIMVAQIDDMIRAITPDAVGTDLMGNTVPIVLEAIDRMVKLMDAKAKLLGLNKAAKVDITVRLKEWARDNNFPEDEVMSVAADVIASRSEVAT